MQDYNYLLYILENLTHIRTYFYYQFLCKTSHSMSISVSFRTFPKR